LPEDIFQFSNMSEVRAASADEWLAVMRHIPEATIKTAIAQLLREPEKKDWGGEENDHCSANVTVNGRRHTADFLLKGPTIFKQEASAGRAASAVPAPPDAGFWFSRRYLP
jgi:hypothetical protein